MPEVATNQKSVSKWYIIGAIIVFMVIVAVIWAVGFGSILKFIGYLAFFLFLLGIAGLLFYLIYDIFFAKKKRDPVFIFRKKLTQACIRNKPKYLANLVLSGDKGHTRVTFGKITGFCRAQIMTERSFFDKNGFNIMVKDPRNPELKVPKTEIIKEEQDIFAVEKSGFPFNLFSMPDLVRVHPSQHSALIGDVVLDGFSLIPISEYWFLNTDMANVQRIDKSILLESKRQTGYIVISEMAEMTLKAMDADSDFNKRLNMKNQVDLPAQGPEQNMPAT